MVVVKLAEGVISSRDTADDTAEFAGVLKFLEASRTFQNWRGQGKEQLKIYLTHLGYHITFWVPTFVSAIPVHLHKLLQDCRLATNTLDSELGRIMEMAI